MPKRKNLEILLILGSLLLSSCASLQDPVNFDESAGPRYFRQILAQPRAPGKTIRVVSYNLGLCKKLDQAVDLLKQDPSLKDADILCLQELNLECLEALARELKCNYLYYPSAVHPENKKDFGCAVLSPWPLDDFQKIILPYSLSDRYHPKLQRCAVAARVMIGEKEIYAVSVHLGVIISPQQRREQLQAVLSAIKADGKSCIIAGDLNTYGRMHAETVKDFMTGAGFDLANKSAGWTYKYWYLFNHRAVLDYIFYRGLVPETSGKVAQRKASDHFPVWAQFLN